VWDAELQRKVVEVEDTNSGSNAVWAVDVSPESTRFATGTRDSKASIWSITTGERLVGPLEHHLAITGTKFSPDGGYIVTACADSIHIFDSYSGDQLITIENQLDKSYPITPIVWSSDGWLFAVCKGGTIKSFDTSTGSQIAEWNIHSEDLRSIALSTDNKSIASLAGHSVSFWDTSTRTQLGDVSEDDDVQSIALSPDGTRLATGGKKNKTITIWNLCDILPESYLPITNTNVNTQDDDDALLEIELPPSTSAPLFDYDEPPSPESHEHPVESGSPALDSSPAKPHSSPGPPMIPGVDLPDPKPTSENPASPEGNHRTIGDWFRTVMTKRSHNRTSRQTPSDASPQSGIPSQAEASPPNERPSTMSPAKRQRRTVGRSTVKRKKKTAQKPAASSQPPKTTPHTEAGPANVLDETKAEPSVAQDNKERRQPPTTTPRSEVGPADVPDEIKPERSGAQNSVEQGAGGLSWYHVHISFALPIPSWICCARADNSGEMH
jgi:WD40 repeat protein